MAANSKSFRFAGFPPAKSKGPLAAACLALLAAIATSLHAQEASVSMKVDLVAWGNDIHGLTLKKEDSNGDITALGFRYSVPVAYSGPLIMEIYQTGSGPAQPTAELSQEDKDHELMPLVAEEKEPAPGEEVRTPIAVELEKRRKENPDLIALAQLPGLSCKRATILLAPAANGTFIAYVIDDDPSKLPPGKFRVHNLSPYEINVRCNGREAKELKTRATHIFNPANNSIIYELAYKQDDEWVVQENNILSVSPTDQVQMIVLRSRNQFFLSSDGSTGGHLQLVTLRREPAQP
jgi:hypothetical protein